MSKSEKVVGLKLKKFRMEWVKDGQNVVMVGSRGRGKSTIVLDLLYHKQDIPYVCCISPTDIFNQTFSPHVPSRFIFSKYSKELLASFLRRQKQITQKKIEASIGLGNPSYKDVDPRAVIVMDDCLADSKGWGNDPSLRWIFYNGRHAHINLVLTMQYQVGIPPCFRGNIDWIFLCRETKKIEREKLYKFYASIFPDFKMFDNIFMACTGDKKCMVIQGLSESVKITDQVFWFKASLHKDFRICYDEFWENNDYYLKKRMEKEFGKVGTAEEKVNDLNPKEGSHVEADDYYKYVGGKNSVQFELKMAEQDTEGIY